MKNFERRLESIGKQFVRQARKNLRKAGKGGGKLESSIKAVVKQTGDGYSLQFLMADYGTFVDKGVKGTGGTIKTGDNAGTWGGRRWFVNYKGKRQDSPYKYGRGTGKKGGLTRGIASFIRKKNLQPRDAKGRYLSPAGLRTAIVRTIWIKGIHGISFFQSALRSSIENVLGDETLQAIKLDILDGLEKVGWKKE